MNLAGLLVLKNSNKTDKNGTVVDPAEKLQKFLEKLAQRELTLQMLPPSLQQAIETLQKTSKLNDQ